MMAGRLETGIEDELKKEIEVPEFMEKPQEKWNEEEHKLAKEYERKKTQVRCKTLYVSISWLIKKVECFKNMSAQ